ncbi:hypothetical protein BU23DRAFT_95996 [Bimuria novae-zelandiae CBS 107.79]|uniref:non-specific serine/threonine protein kinase n=1 Tax=Bimuria novae-zelandiae CBS 107.79 TaxID=1447943 RepID=A0A6A5VBQ7_9PLEO|nr:hypothetical protein BU23DRAFT_95996 [Bimuria novae-zelandiae CBS 107.79]
MPKLRWKYTGKEKKTESTGVKLWKPKSESNEEVPDKQVLCPGVWVEDTDTQNTASPVDPSSNATDNTDSSLGESCNCNTCTSTQAPDVTSSRVTLNEQDDRLYVEYCDRGTLHDEIARYITLATSVPDAFIWTVFRSLALEVKHCHCGPADRDTPWDQIMHRDIIPTNIFLSSPPPAVIRQR